MSGDLRLLNRQRAQPVDLRRLREIVETLLVELLELKNFDLTVQLVGDRQMARLNRQHLDHEGSTDVITLDYSAGDSKAFAGEIFVCLDVAKSQARQFRTTWQSELVRYIVHGVLHLLGHDDLKPVVRRRMKREENRLLAELKHRFSFRPLERKGAA